MPRKFTMQRQRDPGLRQPRWKVASRIIALFAILLGIFATFPKTSNVSDTSSLSWTQHDTGPNGRFTSVSCVSANFCLAVDDQGNYALWNGKTWAQHHIVPSNASDPDHDGDTDSNGNGSVGKLNSVSCVSPSFCVIAGNNGKVITFNGSSFWEGGKYA